MFRIIILLVCGTLFTSSVSAKSVKVIEAQSAEDTSHQYFIELLQLAVSKLPESDGISSVEIVARDGLTHGSLFRLLELESIDILWGGTSADREKTLLPIRFPLMRGLLGYRVSITHKDNLQILRDAGAGIALKKACQVHYWPDADILKDNDFVVIETQDYVRTFELTANKKCDYFPRAIFEGYGELAEAQRKFEDLVMFDDVIIHYPFPYYFFVKKGNNSLATLIEKGLRKASEDGSFSRMMENHPLTKHVFPISKWRDKRVISLSNKTLTNASEYQRNRIWLGYVK